MPTSSSGPIDESLDDHPGVRGGGRASTSRPAIRNRRHARRFTGTDTPAPSAAIESQPRQTSGRIIKRRAIAHAELAQRLKGPTNARIADRIDSSWARGQQASRPASSPATNGHVRADTG